MVAKPDSNCRYALWNNQLTVHYLDGRTEHRVLSTVAELRATLENVFCLNLGEIAEIDRMLQQLIERSFAMT